MVLMFSENTKIYITPTSVQPADVASTDNYSPYITSFNQEGGEANKEQIDVFDGGSETNEQRRNQFEISFDVLVPAGASSNIWDTLDSSTRRVYIEYNDGSNQYTRAYNNVEVEVFNPEFPADGYFQGTVVMKLNATNASGVSNKRVEKVAVTAMTDW